MDAEIWSQCPVDIGRYVLQLAADQNYETARNLALVSQSACAWVTPRLYHTITFPGYLDRDARRALERRFFSSIHGRPSLRLHVRVFDSVEATMQSFNLFPNLISAACSRHSPSERGILPPVLANLKSLRCSAIQLYSTNEPTKPHSLASVARLSFWYTPFDEIGRWFKVTQLSQLTHLHLEDSIPRGRGLIEQALSALKDDIFPCTPLLKICIVTIPDLKWYKRLERDSITSQLIQGGLDSRIVVRAVLLSRSPGKSEYMADLEGHSVLCLDPSSSMDTMWTAAEEIVRQRAAKMTEVES